ncbi:hypothetical protein LDC_1787 [sediment metagenome]|uniref:Uncharacterized protein n=1 Tax=sediment metagenome TaxID=749907 RepID=D9PJS3_9ZZZZ
MSKKGFSPEFLLLIAQTLVFFGVIFYFLPRLTSKNGNYIADPFTSDVKKLDGETHDVIMYPGTSKYELPSGAVLAFGRAGTPESVPDFIYGQRYNLNDIHNVNYLPIYNRLVTYHNGYKYDITNEKCETREKLDVDVMITEVTKCYLKVQSVKEGFPLTESNEVSKSFKLTERGDPIKGLQSGDEKEPLLYVYAEPVRIQKNVIDEIYLSPGSDWDVYMVTGYGIETIRYSAQDLWNKLVKMGNAGEQKIEVTVDDLSCTNLNVAGDCPYFTEISFTVTLYPLEDGAAPVVILFYN